MTFRILTTPVGGGALTHLALSGSAPESWYPRVPRGTDEWIAHCRRIMKNDSSWLAPLRDAFGARGAQLLERVDAGRGVVVTTGQQPGLFGGPLYVVHKALSALELAIAIERETGVPAVPVFWAATDDADFVEAASTALPLPRSVEQIGLTHRPPDGVPMSHATMTEETLALLDALRTACASVADERPLVAAESFRAGATIGDGYVAMLRTLLEPMGIAVFDVAHDSAAATMAVHCRHALECAAPVHRALEDRAAAITGAGYEPTVDTERDLSVVFEWIEGDDSLPRKRRVPIHAAAAAAQRRGRFSPNVLFRPVTERALFPTAAYVGGPGEIAYFAQVSAVADALSCERPLIVPRWSGMIVPEEVDAVLASFDLEPASLRDVHGLEARVARAALAPSAMDAMADLRASIARTITKLAGTMTDAALDGAKNQLTIKADRLERRLLAAAKHREQGTLRRIHAARDTLFPFGTPQERALNFVPFWSRYGDALISETRAACAAHARGVLAGAQAPV
jgi:uncharacterized protein YllA (UPF0747 family)